MEKFKATPSGREAEHPSLGLWGGAFSWGPDKQRWHGGNEQMAKRPLRQRISSGFLRIRSDCHSALLVVSVYSSERREPAGKPLLLIHKTDRWLGKVLARLRACTHMVLANPGSVLSLWEEVGEGRGGLVLLKAKKAELQGPTC